MKKRYRLLCVMLVSAVAFQGLSLPVCADEVIIYGNEGNEGAPLWDEDVLTDEAGELPAENSQENEDLPLVEDEGIVISVQEGASWEEVQEAEAEAEKAREEARLAGLLARETPALQPASADRLRDRMEQLLEMPSPTGSDGELEVASLIERIAGELGYDVQEQAFHEGFLNADYVDTPGLNILVEKGVSSENPTRKILLVTAHYDSKTLPASAGVGEGLPEMDAVPDSSGEYLSGTDAEVAGAGEDMQDAAVSRADRFDADNDKTGAAVLLETARILAGIESDVDICFVFLSGEEDGYYGSLRLIESLSEDLRSRICGVICVGTNGVATLPTVLGTKDGQANDPALLLRMCALESDAAALIDGVIQDPAPEDGLRDWELMEQAGLDAPEVLSTAGRFIEAGFEVVSVGQVRPESEEELAIDYEQLARTTNVLAETIVRFMFSKT